MSRIAVLVFFFSFALGCLATAQNDEAKDLVVMVHSELGGGYVPGAGIVFNVANDRIYIVTAKHVVASGSVEDGDFLEASSVNVEFWQLPGEQFEATLNGPLDTALDMAVLSLRVEDVGPTAATFPFALLAGGDIDASETVTTIGQGSGQAWAALVEPTNVVDTTGGLLELQNGSVSQGDSGGGLFAETGELLGMVVDDAPPALRVIESETLFAELENNRYAVASANNETPPDNEVVSGEDSPRPVPSGCPGNTTFQCATFLPFGSSDSDEFEGSSPVYYSFNLDQPETVVLTLNPMPNTRSVYIALYDDQYNRLDDRTFDRGQPGSFDADMPGAGLYYIEVKPASCCSGAPYNYTLALDR